MTMDGNENIDETNQEDSGGNMSSYITQWNYYFGSNSIAAVNGKNLLDRLRAVTYKESLRSCCFRSVCWRMFLGCIPDDINEWPKAVEHCRENYSRLKASHVTIPQQSKDPNDIEVENPLSQSDQSSWSQYFRNNELRNLIERDVRRTCPELDFYHSTKVHEMMANILFCYAREHESLSYRQGMHELLAPLIFVLHCDLQGAAHARDLGQLPPIVSNLLNEEFLEHDAYQMFSKVMDATNGWYSVTESPVKDQVDSASKEDEDPIPTVPFKDSDQSSSNGMAPLEITNKLNHIHENLLAKHDLELYHHLTRLQIIPQVYGLRWVRLLFGRELDLQDLLVLWDSMFADSPTLDLVDYIFVAMMVNIRDQLLLSDYCGCMQLLMKYPPIEDIYDLVNLAMYFRDPANKRRPSHTKFRKPLSPNITSNENSQLKKGKSNNFLPSFKIDNPFSSLGRDIKKALQTSPNTLKNTQVNENDGKRFMTKSNGKPVKEQRQRFNRMQAMQDEKQIDLEKEVISLRQKNIELQEKCRFCSDKLDANIRLLQHGVDGRGSRSNSNAAEERPSEEFAPDQTDDDTCVAVANLKQVRDILRGTLNMDASFPSLLLQEQVDSLPTPPDDPLPSDAKEEDVK